MPALINFELFPIEYRSYCEYMTHYENMPVTYDIDIKIDSEAVFIQKGYRVIKLLN